MLVRRPAAVPAPPLDPEAAAKAREAKIVLARRATARLLSKMGGHFRNAMAAAFSMSPGEAGASSYEEVMKMYKIEINNYGNTVLQVPPPHAMPCHAMPTVDLIPVPPSPPYNGTAQHIVTRTHCTCRSGAAL